MHSKRSLVPAMSGPILHFHINCMALDQQKRYNVYIHIPCTITLLVSGASLRSHTAGTGFLCI